MSNINNPSAPPWRLYSSRCAIMLGAVAAVCLVASPSRSDESGAGLTAEASPRQIADYLLQLRAKKQSSSALVARLPKLDRQRAFAVQGLTRQADEAAGREVVGYKMGGTVLRKEGDKIDPILGYSLDSQQYKTGDSIPADQFVGQQVLVEAEITVFLKSDLRGPEVSRDEVVAAIAGVRPSIEIINCRVLPLAEGKPESRTPNHLVADNMCHGGAVMGEKLVSLSEVDVARESVVAIIDGQEKAKGQAKYVFGNGDLVSAVHAAAKLLIDQGRYLQAGQFIQTGSLYENPALEKGQTVVVRFSTLGEVRLSLR